MITQLINFKNESVFNQAAYLKWKRKNVSLRGEQVKGEYNGAGAMLGNGLYTAALSNKVLAKGYGQVYFVVNAIPKKPLIFNTLNDWQIYFYNKLVFNYSKAKGKEFPDKRDFNANTTIEDEIQKMGYDGIIITGREYVNYKPENIIYFNNEIELKNYYENYISINEGINVFHGSDRKFDTFDINMIGSGDAKALGGWGIYFSDAKNVSDRYKTNNGFVKEYELKSGNYFDLDEYLTDDIHQEITTALNNQTVNETDIEQFLSDFIPYECTNKQVYEWLSYVFDGIKGASEFLQSIGYLGNKFKDKINTMATNYVVFDTDSIISEINESVTPSRFKDTDLSDILEFVDQLLYNNKNIDITEKIAGQHLTLDIKNNFVNVFTKDSILANDQGKNAKYTKYGKELNQAVIKYLQTTKLPDQKWSFEIINPSHNHDYIKYKNTDIIYVEYTGLLTTAISKEIRKYLPKGIKLLTHNDLKLSINQNQAFIDFKKLWETQLKAKYTALNPNNKSKFYFKEINNLKYMIGELLEKIVFSVVDNQSPIEGVVVNGKQPFKLQTNQYLGLQRIQITMYSLFKVSKDEIKFITDNPLMKLKDIKQKYNLQLTSIYVKDLDYSLYDIVKYYLIKNSDLTIDNTKYKQWLTPQESKNLLNTLTQQNVVQVYNKIYSLK